MSAVFECQGCDFRTLIVDRAEDHERISAHEVFERPLPSAESADTPAPAQEAHVEALAAAVCDSKHGHYVTACFSCSGWAEYASDWLAAFVAERQAEAFARGREAGAAFEEARWVGAGVIGVPRPEVTIANPYRTPAHIKTAYCMPNCVGCNSQDDGASC